MSGSDVNRSDDCVGFWHSSFQRVHWQSHAVAQEEYYYHDSMAYVILGKCFHESNHENEGLDEKCRSMWQGLGGKGNHVVLKVTFQ
jgi:hypothetical protein